MASLAASPRYKIKLGHAEQGCRSCGARIMNIHLGLNIYTQHEVSDDLSEASLAVPRVRSTMLIKQQSKFSFMCYCLPSPFKTIAIGHELGTE